MIIVNFIIIDKGLSHIYKNAGSYTSGKSVSIDFQAFLIVMLLSFIYYKISNLIVAKKINKLFQKNDYEKSLKYLDKCLETHPRMFSLKFDRTESLFLKCDYPEFKASAASLWQDKRIKEKKYSYLLKGFESIIGFLVEGKQDIDFSVSAPKASWEKILYLICNKNDFSSDEIESIALEAFNSPYNLIKSIAAAFLANVYKEKSDLNHFELYSKKAKELAVSPEALHGIKALLGEL